MPVTSHCSRIKGEAIGQPIAKTASPTKARSGYQTQEGISDARGKKAGYGITDLPPARHDAPRKFVGVREGLKRRELYKAEPATAPMEWTGPCSWGSLDCPRRTIGAEL